MKFLNLLLKYCFPNNTNAMNIAMRSHCIRSNDWDGDSFQNIGKCRLQNELLGAFALSAAHSLNENCIHCFLFSLGKSSKLTETLFKFKLFRVLC